MAVASYAASVQGVALRVTRLDAQGYPLTGPEDVYVTRAFMRVSFTPEYEDGDEITEKNAAGEVCVTYKAPDTLKRATMEIAICDPDPEFTELLSGGVLLKYGESGVPPASGPTPPNFSYPGATVGYASVKVGESPNPNGVGVEVWSLAIKDGARDNDLPYYRWIFPKATLRPSGDRVIENGLLANTFEGWSVGNIHFGTGPADDWYWPDATDRPFAYARDYTNPWTGTNGWYIYSPPAVSDTGVPEKDPATGLRLVEYGVTNVATVTLPTSPRPYLLYEAENPDYGQVMPTATVTGATAGTQGVGGQQAFAAPTGPAGPGARRTNPQAPTVQSRPQGPDQAQGAAERIRPESAEATGSTGSTGSTDSATGNKSE